MKAGTGENEYLEKLKESLEIIKKFNPEILGISAGFDTFKGDPLANINLEIGSYQKIGKLISELKKPNFTVLEGGYSDRLPECIYAYLQGLKQA